MTAPKKSQAANTSSASTLNRLTGWKLWVGMLFLLIGAVALFIGQSAVWISNTVFDQKTFVETTNQVLTTEEGRNDIAALIVDSALQDRPAIKRVISGQATSLLSGLLGTDLASNIYNRIANGAYAYITSPNQQDIAIDLTSIKTPLSGIVSFAENRGQSVQFDPSQIPDQILILDADEVPSLSSTIQVILILNVLFWALSIITFTGYIMLKKGGRIRRTYHVLLAIATVALVGLLAGPFVPPIIASFIALIDARSIVTALTNAYLAPFITQMWFMLTGAAIVALALSLRGYAKQAATRLMATLPTKK